MSNNSTYQDFFKKAKKRSQQLKSSEEQLHLSLSKQAKEIKDKKNVETKNLQSQINNKNKSKNKKSYFSSNGIGFSIVGIIICSGYIFYGEGVDSFTSKLHISLFEKTLAKEEPKKNESLATPPGDEESGALSPQKIDHLKNLVKLQEDLKKREEELIKIEKENDKKAQEIEKNLKELERLRDEISTRLADRLAADSKKIDQLVEVYSTMRPAQAAKIFEDLSEELAVQVLSKMKKKNAAEVLNLMNVEKAKKFAELFTGYQSYENK